jgi:hypothetical protein
MDNNISFSKIVATPTLNSWSQAYNAGKLFAVLSLEKSPESSEIESLNMLGKDLLERLEQEFFAIETKNLESIKKAIFTIFEKNIPSVTVSFAAGALLDNVLYLFGLGNSKVFIKRGGNFGLALDSSSETSKKIIASSGFIKENDLIVLTTDGFSEAITQGELNSSLNDSEPSEITEALAPRIHKAENGKISAIFIRYKTPKTEEILDEGTDIEEEIQQTAERVEQTENAKFSLFTYLALLKSKFSQSSFKLKPTRQIFLLAAVAIVGIIIFSIFAGIREQNNAKIKALFDSSYPQAQKKYEEGQSLADLNKTLARDAFIAAQKILNDNKDKFPAKSKELTQTQDLLVKIDAGLSLVSPIDKSGLDRSTLSITVQNGSGTEGAAGKAANILKDLGYNVSSTGNADNYNYVGVTIKVKSEDSKFTDLLKKDLSKDYTVKASSSDLSSDSPSSAVVIIGK